MAIEWRGWSHDVHIFIQLYHFIRTSIMDFQIARYHKVQSRNNVQSEI